MSETSFYNPNENAVDYAVSVARNTLDMLRRRGLALDGATVLEIGPGSDFAVALVLASHGAAVTLADRFLAPWKAEYHPDFYRAFLARWDGPAAAVEAVLARGGYDGVLRLLPAPAEALGGIADGSIDLVLSNAVLEHVRDFPQVVRELARIGRPGGVQAHQVDCRHHRDFTRPLDHLLIPEAAFAAERAANGCIHGTQLRLQDMAEAFAGNFWLDEIEPNCFAEDSYLDALLPRLGDRFAAYPRQSLRILGGRLWLSRKPQATRPAIWRRLLG